jgi:hypothetical protein
MSIKIEKSWQAHVAYTLTHSAWATIALVAIACFGAYKVSEATIDYGVAEVERSAQTLLAMN